MLEMFVKVASTFLWVFSSEVGRAPQYNSGVTAPKDEYDAQQPDCTVARSPNQYFLGAFPVPQYHEIQEKKFSSGTNKHVAQF